MKKEQNDARQKNPSPSTVRENLDGRKEKKRARGVARKRKKEGDGDAKEDGGIKMGLGKDGT